MRVGSPSSRKSSSPIANRRTGVLMRVFPTFLICAEVPRPRAGRPRRYAPGRPARPDGAWWGVAAAGLARSLSGDREALLRAVGAGRLVPRGDRGVEVRLARVRLAHRVRVDAVRVDLERHVAPARQDRGGRRREQLVDLLAAEV